MPLPGGIEKVGFIDLGRMEMPVVGNILEAGFDLTGYNRRKR